MVDFKNELLLVNALFKDDINAAVILNGYLVFKSDGANVTQADVEEHLKTLQAALNIQEVKTIEFSVHQNILNWDDILESLASFGKVQCIKLQLSDFQNTVTSLIRATSKEKQAIVNIYPKNKGLSEFITIKGKAIESITLREVSTAIMVQCIHINEPDAFGEKVELTIDTIFPMDETILTQKNY